MGLGPNGSSLLVKLGRQPAHLMDPAQLLALVTKLQAERTIARSLGRAKRIISDPTRSSKKKSAKRKPPNRLSLEASIGPDLATKLRAKWPSKTDSELMLMLAGQGLL